MPRGGLLDGSLEVVQGITRQGMGQEPMGPLASLLLQSRPEDPASPDHLPKAHSKSLGSVSTLLVETQCWPRSQRVPTHPMRPLLKPAPHLKALLCLLACLLAFFLSFLFLFIIGVLSRYILDCNPFSYLNNANAFIL